MVMSPQSVLQSTDHHIHQFYFLPYSGEGSSASEEEKHLCLFVYACVSLCVQTPLVAWRVVGSLVTPGREGYGVLFFQWAYLAPLQWLLGGSETQQTPQAPPEISPLSSSSTGWECSWGHSGASSGWRPSQMTSGESGWAEERISACYWDCSAALAREVWGGSGCIWFLTSDPVYS